MNVAVPGDRATFQFTCISEEWIAAAACARVVCGQTLPVGDGDNGIDHVVGPVGVTLDAIALKIANTPIKLGASFV
jgi:hypothetical protein